MSWGWSLDQVYMTSMQEVMMRVGVWHGLARKLHALGRVQGSKIIADRLVTTGDGLHSKCIYIRVEAPRNLAGRRQFPQVSLLLEGSPQ